MACIAVKSTLHYLGNLTQKVVQQDGEAEEVKIPKDHHGFRMADDYRNRQFIGLIRRGNPL